MVMMCHYLGRDCLNESSQNPGIAKRGGLIYAILSSKCHESHLRAFVVKSTRVPGLGKGGGGSSQSWQCQDFESS